MERESRLLTLAARIEALLHGDTALLAEPTESHRRHTLPQLIALIGGFGGIYGAVMGSFGGVLGDRLLQIVYSGIKVPILLLGVFVIGLPSFYVFNTLLGVREDFRQALRALMSSQAGLAILLASLAPLTLLWNVSTLNYPQTILFNGAMFGLAAFGGQILLRRHYRELLSRDPRHRILLRIWGVQYAFIGIQLGWLLRPFIGILDRPVSFFRADTWGNAYEILFQMLRSMLERR